MQIWFNPACSKCRMTTEALDAAGVDYDVRRYLDEPPTRDELADVLGRLGLEPWDVTRLGEPRAAELGLADAARDRGTWLDVLAANPELIQRPIVVTDDGSAWIPRDPETLDHLIGHVAAPSSSG
ncbi:MAG: arsenate reductase family protein [Frankiales bacterium]|nr:arsenate reductase family protein [Frankiales bacterium]